MKIAAVAMAALSTAEAIGSWTIVASDLGVLGAKMVMYDTEHGLLPINANGVGAAVLSTSDGGKTWPTAAPARDVLFALSGAGYGKTAVVSGPLGQMFSLDAGKSFNVSKGMIPSQAVTVLGSNSGYIAVGHTGPSTLSGDAISTTAGQTFKASDIPQLQTLPRSVAAPTKDVLYIAAGTWPGDSQDAHDHTYTHHVTERLHLVHNKASNSIHVELGAMKTGSSGNSTNGYMAQLLKSEDGGKTWISQFLQPNEFYFNGIACHDATHCCAAAESDGGAVNGYNGAYIFCTQDGGANWEQSYSNTENDSSLMAVATGEAGEYWAVGGVMGELGNFSAWFVHSTDYGATWALQETIDGQYGTSVTCLGAQCWATTIDVFQAASVARNF